MLGCMHPDAEATGDKTKYFLKKLLFRKTTTFNNKINYLGFSEW
jgi:hypothetical protein